MSLMEMPMNNKNIDYEKLFELADKTIKDLLGIFENNISISPKELYELSQVMNRYNDESIKIIHKE